MMSIGEATELRYTYMDYAYGVKNGTIKAGRLVQLAVDRFFSFLERPDMEFREDVVQYKIRFAYKMKHFEGSFNNKHFLLLPFQQFIFANIFGFFWRGTDRRVTRKVFVMISRKAGKTALMAALALCCAVADNEPGAEVDMVANNAKQAAICFKHTKGFAESLDPKHKIFKLYRSDVKIPQTKSLIQVLSSDSMGLDGYSSSCFIFDEIHAQKDWALWNVMVSSQGARQNPLAVAITTAGFLIGPYPCYEMWNTCSDILHGLKQDDSQFSMIFQMDDGDDVNDENNWPKCQPSLDVTVGRDYMREQLNSAKNNSSLTTGVYTKNFNMWCSSKEVWIPDEYIKAVSMDIDIDRLSGEVCYAGVDLAAVSDIVAEGLFFPPNPDREYLPDKCVFWSKMYVPEVALEESTNAELYKQQVRQKNLHLSEGNIVDYDAITKDLQEYESKFCLMGVFYDKWNAASWAIKCTELGLPLVPYSQSLGSFNIPTKSLEMLIRSNQCVIPNNAVLRWMFANSEIKVDFNDNFKPVKANGDKSRKIDGVIAIIQALGGYLCSPNYQPEVIPL